MLQKLNERIQGAVAWIVVVLVTLTFTLFGIDYYLQSRHESAPQAEVNGQPISKQAFELSYRRTRQMRDPSQLNVARENQLKQQVLDDMIVNSLSLQSARTNGFEVNSAQANAAIVSIPQFQEDGHFSTNKYAQALSGAFFTPESFQQEVRQGMLLNQQRFALIGTAFSLPNELKQFVKLYLQTRDYTYLKIPALQFLKQSEISDDEVRSYYQQNKNVFLSPEKVSIDYVQLSMRDIKNQLTVSTEQLKRYYDENQNNYLTPAQWQVAKIVLNIPVNASTNDVSKVKERAEKLYQTLQTDPAQFEAKMKSLSVNKLSDNGALPWIVAGHSAYDKDLVNLTTPGQLSPPIKSAQGYEIFKLLAYKPAAMKSFEDVRPIIQAQLLTELSQTQYTQALEQLADLSYQTPDSLALVGKVLKIKVNHSELFDRQGGDSELTKNKQVIRAAFSQDVLKFGNNSEPIQVDNDSVVVLRVNQHISAAEKALVDVKLLIAKKLARKKAEAEAKRFGQQLLEVTQNGKQSSYTNDSKVKNSNAFVWHDVLSASRDNDTVAAAINELAFSMPGVGQKAGCTLLDGDYAIVNLKKINNGQIESLDKEQIASIKQQIEASDGLMDYNLYINGLMNKATIVKH
ncbi:MAG: SurA N-terminal domain-containing protein [Legionellaceae bacterium]|nr:SurA N-terminal domain-containing protein [Legionellaceae bacterium]